MSLGKGEKWGKAKRVREKEKRAYSSQASWSRSSSTADPWREGTTSTAEERGRSNQQRNGQNSSYNGRRKESYQWKTRKVSTTEGYFQVAPMFQSKVWGTWLQKRCKLYTPPTTCW